MCAASPARNRLVDEGNKVQQTREGIDLKNLPAGQWWWD
jgi:hypothetical protein